jgi:predicted  nucleic acid-binding Zn-ribbon protein
MVHPEDQSVESVGSRAKLQRDLQEEVEALKLEVAKLTEERDELVEREKDLGHELSQALEGGTALAGEAKQKQAKLEFLAAQVKKSADEKEALANDVKTLEDQMLDLKQEHLEKTEALELQVLKEQQQRQALHEEADGLRQK